MMPGMYQVVIFKSVEKLLQLALEQDPSSRMRLEALEGQRVFIEIHQPEFQGLLKIEGGSLRWLAESHEPAHATLEARSLDLLRQFFNSQPQWVQGPVHLGGDVELIQKLHEIFTHLEIDWEEPLARWFGDPLAHQMGRGIRQLARFTRRSARVMFQNSREYLQEELGAIPMRWELDELTQEIQDLSADTDRVNDRMRRLEELLQHRNGS